MVMVVVHSVFVACGRTNRLDASKKTVLDQHPEGVVHGLARDGPDVRLRDLGDVIRGHVWLTRHRPKNRDALGRRLNAALAKLVDRAHAH